MSNKLYAPQVDYYVGWMGNQNYGFSDNRTTYDAKSYENIDKFFELLKQISPISENGCRELWFCVEKGTIDKFGDYFELLDCGEVENYQEFEKLWNDNYPDEQKWYRIEALYDEKVNYKVIVVNYNVVIVVEPNTKKGYENDISEFTQWLCDEAENAITKIKNGSYMNFVRENVPVIHRTGTILQKYLWELYPEDKEEFFSGISDDDILDFIGYVNKQPTDIHKPKERLDKMTANDFFNFCAMGYKAMSYEGCELSPKEQYKKNADGRDDGLLELDANSTEAFKLWLNKKDGWSGHPWEVCRGGNSTHISLYVNNDENGYYLYLAGSSYGRTNETIKFYLALCRAGLPVWLSEADVLVERVLGTEKVGVVPQGIIPKYRSGDFPNEKVISFMNLPYEDTELVAEKCVWQDIREVNLIDMENSKDGTR